MKKVVIIGAGFAGLNAAKGLANKKGIEVVIIDRRNHHLFQPLLYQVAMAGLSPAEIAAPIRAILSHGRNVKVLMGEVEQIHPEEKKIMTSLGDISFDYLICAAGARHFYFGNEKWENFAPGLKTLEQATEIRRRVLVAFERAEHETDPQKKRDLLSFVVVGGGPTGVELAGALGEISRFTLSKDFRSIDPNSTRIFLIERGPRILSSFSESLSRKAARSLESLGVQISTNSQVTNITTEGVEMGGEILKAKTVLWAAGIKASALNQGLGEDLDWAGRVKVEEDLSLKGHPNIFVIGDAAHFEHGGQTLPSLAPVAIQEGEHVAKNLLLSVKKEQTKPFRYFDKGQLATIGRRKAVMEYGWLKSHGFFAWCVWLIVHIYYLIGFKNRIFVFFEWAFHYMTYKKGARLIVSKDWKFFGEKPSTEADKKQA